MSLRNNEALRRVGDSFGAVAPLPGGERTEASDIAPELHLVLSVLGYMPDAQ